MKWMKNESVSKETIAQGRGEMMPRCMYGNGNKYIFIFMCINVSTRVYKCLCTLVCAFHSDDCCFCCFQTNVAEKYGVSQKSPQRMQCKRQQINCILHQIQLWESEKNLNWNASWTKKYPTNTEYKTKSILTSLQQHSKKSRTLFCIKLTQRSFCTFMPLSHISYSHRRCDVKQQGKRYPLALVRIKSFRGCILVTQYYDKADDYDCDGGNGGRVD